jgi:Cu2+-exporting ATPase
MTHNPPLIHCFHCGLSVPDGLDIQVNIDGKNEAMCCYGCQAVAQAIINSGMGDFYKFRTTRSQKAR